MQRVDGDDERDGGFDEFYATSRDSLAVQLAAMTGDAAEAVDHVQEAFIRAWARWDRVGRLDDPAAWVRRVAYHLAISRWRRARRTVLGPSVPDAAIDWDDTQLEVVELLQLLPRRHREAVVLHHLAGLPVADVATELAAPVATVRSWLARGRRQLADALAHTDTYTEEVGT